MSHETLGTAPIKAVMRSKPGKMPREGKSRSIPRVGFSICGEPMNADRGRRRIY